MFDWLKNIYNQIKDLNTSVEAYKKETGNQSQPSVAYLNRAKKLMDKSQFLEARDILTEALLITQNDALVYKYLGTCEEHLGNFEGALYIYKKSASLNPQDKNIWHKLGMVQVNLKNYAEAEKYFEQADKVSPVNTDIQTGWGMALMKQKKLSQAHEKFSKAIQFNRYNFSAMLLCAIVESKMGKYDDAERKLSFLMQTKPSEGAAFEYANLCFLKENYESAINYALKSLSYNPAMLPSYLLLGRIYSYMFDYENSMKYFALSEQHKLESAYLYTDWGYALIRLYRFDEAKAVLEKVLKYDESDKDAITGIALCNAEMGDFELVPVDEENVFAIEYHGLKYFKENDLENAVKCFKNALEKDHREVYNYYRLAKCYEKLNNNEMVKDSYDKFVKSNPDYAPVYIDYARYLIDLHEYKDAQRKLRKAESLDKNNQKVLNLLFYTSYILVKENVCEYNVKEAIAIADRTESFEYPELRVELEEILKTLK